MATFTFKNVSGQGQRVDVVRSGSVVGFFLGSDLTASIDGDSIHPNTQALLDGGFLKLVVGEEAQQFLPRPALPMVYFGVFVNGGVYPNGAIVKHNGTFWLSLSDKNSTTPSIGATWLLFTNDDSNTEHIERTDNPHVTTAEQVGAVPLSKVGAPNGVAQLDQDQKINISQLPSLLLDSAVAAAWSLKHERNKDEALGLGTSDQVTANQLKTHLSNTNNPHNVTLVQLGGLAQSLLAQPSGIATLDTNGTLTPEQLPASFRITGTYIVTNNAQRDALASSISSGSVVMTTGTKKVWLWTGSTFVEWYPPGAGITSVNGITQPVVNLTTKLIPEHPSNLYFTNARVASAPAVVALSNKSHDKNRDSFLDMNGPYRVSAAEIKAHLGNQNNPHRVTASQVGAIEALMRIKQVTADYTIQEIDLCYNIRVSGESVITLPAGLPVNFQVTITRIGTDDVIIASEVNLQSRGNTLSERYAACIAYHLGDGIWEAIGNLT